MKNVLSALLMFLTVALNAQEVTVISVGTGSDRSEAINASIQSALESTVSFMTSDTKIVNDEIVHDEVSIISQGAVKQTKILEEYKTLDGRYYVSMEVKLSETELVDYFQRSGASEITFSGRDFANTITRLELNEKTELQAIQDLLAVAEQYSGNTMDYSLVDYTTPVKTMENKYKISYTVQGELNANYDELARLLILGLKNIALEKNESKKRQAYNMETYPYSISAGKNSVFNYRFRNPESINALEEYRRSLSQTYDDFDLMVDNVPLAISRSKLSSILSEDVSVLFSQPGAQITWNFSGEVTKDAIGDMERVSLSKGIVKSNDKSRKEFNKMLQRNKNRITYYTTIGAEINYLQDFNYPVLNHQQQVNAVTTVNVNQADNYLTVLTYLPTEYGLNKVRMGMRLFEKIDINLSYSQGNSEFMGWRKSSLNGNYIISPSTNILRIAVGVQGSSFTGRELDGILVKDDNNNTIVLRDYDLAHTMYYSGVNVSLLLDYRYFNLTGQCSFTNDSQGGTILSTSLYLGIDLN